MVRQSFNHLSILFASLALGILFFPITGWFIHQPVVTARAWSGFILTLRRFFEERGFLEVFTDALVDAGAVESSIDPLRVSYRGGSAELHTSPELEMKKALAEIRESIFQIAHCFRDDPPSAIHKREFTMLEFYQPGADYRMMQTLMCDLLSYLSPRVLTFEAITVMELFERVGIDLFKSSTLPSLREAVQKQGMHVSEKDSWNDLFFKVMVEKVEPMLPSDRPILVTDYPLSTSPMSKRIAGTDLAERFEIYWKGMELCNGSTELVERGDLIARLELEREARKREGKEPHPFPQALLTIIEKLPPCAGVAVGVDRLYSVFANFSSFSREQ